MKYFILLAVLLVDSTSAFAHSAVSCEIQNEEGGPKETKVVNFNSVEWDPNGLKLIEINYKNGFFYHVGLTKTSEDIQLYISKPKEDGVLDPIFGTSAVVVNYSHYENSVVIECKE
jgi:hypothetical protein